MCFYKSSALNFYGSYLYFSLAETYLLRETMINKMCYNYRILDIHNNSNRILRDSIFPHTITIKYSR